MRRLGTLLLLLLVLLAAAAIYAVANLNRHLQENRAWLAEQASAALGREVEFDDVRVSLHDGLAVRVGGLSVGDDPAFSKEEFLRVDSAYVVVKILPALRGRYEVRKIALEAPRVNIIRNAGGFNFESIGARPQTSASGDAAAAAKTPAEADAAALPLLVSLVEIRDGRVRVVDRTASPSTEIAVDKLDVSASDLGFEQPIAVEMAAALLGANEQNLRVSGSVGPLGDAGAAARAPVDLEAKLGPWVIDRLKKAALVGAAIPAELSSPDPVAAVVKLSGRLDDVRAALSVDASKAAIAYGDQIDKASGVPLRIRADVKRGAEAIEIGSLDLRVGAAELRGKGRIGTGKNAPIDFELDGDAVPLGGWGALAPAAAAVEAGGTVDVRLVAKGDVAGGRLPALNGTLAFAGARLATSDGAWRIDGVDTVVSLKGDRVEIPETKVGVNGSPVQVAATVKNLRDLSAEFSLAADEIPLAGLAGAGATETQQAEVVKGVEVRGEFRAAKDGPRLKVSLRSSRGSVRDIAYEDLRGEARLHGKQLTVERFSVSVFGGNVLGAGSFDAAAEAPEVKFRGKVGGLDVAAFRQRFAPSGKVEMSGRLDADLDLRGSGGEWEVLRQALLGSGSMEVKEGVLKGVNLADEVLRSITRVQGLSGLISPSLRKKYPEIFASEDTVFDTLDGEVTIAKGMAAVDKLALAAHDYRLDGKGTIGLDSTVDLRVLFTASAQLSDDLRGSVKQLKYVMDDQGRFQLPLVLGGSIPSLRPQPDVEFLSKQLAGALVESGIEKGLDVLLGKKKKESAGPAAGAAPRQEGAPEEKEDPAAELIRKGLKGLFGGAKNPD